MEAFLLDAPRGGGCQSQKMLGSRGTDGRGTGRIRLRLGVGVVYSHLRAGRGCALGIARARRLPKTSIPIGDRTVRGRRPTIGRISLLTTAPGLTLGASVFSVGRRCGGLATGASRFETSIEIGQLRGHGARRLATGRSAPNASFGLGLVSSLRLAGHGFVEGFRLALRSVELLSQLGEEIPSYLCCCARLCSLLWACH